MKDLQIGQVVDINNLKIIPVEEISIYNRSAINGTAVYGAKKPFAVIIHEKERTMVFGISKREITLDFLICEVEGLHEILNN